MQELADKAEVTIGAISNYKNGHRKPRPNIALRIVKATKGKVTLEDLYSTPAGKTA